MREKKSVIEFLIIVSVLSCIVDFIWIRGGEAATARGISVLLMWCPAIAAFIVRFRHYRKEKLLGWNKCKISYILLAIAVPAVYLSVSYIIYWMINKGSFTGVLKFPEVAASKGADNTASRSVLVYMITWLAMIVSSIIAAAGEEIGWRGFLFPQLAKIWNFKTAVIISGLIWAVWHMPIMLAGLYNSGTTVWYQLPMFVIDIMCFTVIISLLRAKSNSVWPAILIHAFHNNIDQALLGPMTVGANKAYFVGETGVITIGAIILVTFAVVKLLEKRSSDNAANNLDGSVS
jgi:membrane protease YdiL (CAAX protease family)